MALLKLYVQKQNIDGKLHEFTSADLQILDTTNCAIFADGSGSVFYNTASGAQIFTSIPLAQLATSLSATDLSAYT